MENFRQIENNFLKSLDNFDVSSKESALNTFHNLWMSEEKYFAHYEKRKKEGFVADRFDYMRKTFNTITSEEVYFETYEMPELWDRVFYSKDDNTAVVLAKNGKILTSYQIKTTIEKTFKKHIDFLNAKIIKMEVSDEFSRQIESIANKLALF
ncbi:MAG: hypothetical protein M0P91_05695 [Sulfuricurvum sp.]|uniref:hypothetical protein n=1 Tax=Sulfuricurvum sp. TaxID=2025608 RepID=UPI0025D02CDE|nr:hypothetical protein [Sulfuricurvum sp.]MCK9372671.1 hypothetical protein [Sulfuricurvum sp.]